MKRMMFRVPSLLLFTILLSRWMQFGASWPCSCWSGTSSFATSILHHHHPAGIIDFDCKQHYQQYPHPQQRIQNSSRRRRQISLFSNRSSKIFSSGNNHIHDNDNDNEGHGTSDEEDRQPQPPKGIRLNKVFKATHSRREADALIESGRVCVNGVAVEPNNLGMRVVPFQDVVSLDGNAVYGWEAMNAIAVQEGKNSQEQRMDRHRPSHHHHHHHLLHLEEEEKGAIHDDNNCNTVHDYQPLENPASSSSSSFSSSSFEYIKYYKPVGVTCTTDSRIKDNIIDDLIHNHGYRPRHRVYPVGRLDKETSGLILLTSDGRVVNSVLRGENKHPKVYNVMVNDRLTEEDMQRLRDGIVITTVSQRKGRSIEENTLVAKTKKAIVERIGQNSCRMTLVEGRNRQIRKMMEALGLRVVRLHRVEFMGIRLATSSSSTTSRKEMENVRNCNTTSATDYGLKRPGDWAYLDEREMNLIENAIRIAQGKKEIEI